MKKKDFAFIAALLLAALLASVSWGATPQPADQPDYIVRVLVDFGKYLDVGTGSVIRRDLIITANHVIRDDTPETPIYVEFLDGKRVVAEILRQDDPQDLALLKIPPCLIPRLHVSATDPYTGEVVTIRGFAHGEDYMELTGKVNGWFLFDKQGSSCFTVSGVSISGMSGGPATNKDGLLVGTLTGADDKDSYLPNAEKINKFLEGLDLSRYDGIIE